MEEIALPKEMHRTNPGSVVHVFGIRHHGPGSARSLIRELERLQPDCVLIEGPPEANGLIHHVSDPMLKPPVALLIHAADDPSRSSFYPFTVFSPEWQAMTWALKNEATVKFIDLPVANHLALLEKEIESIEKPPSINDLFESDTDIDGLRESEEKNRNDLSQATGSKDPEEWWNRMVEERPHDDGIFEGIAKGMEFLRAEIGFGKEKSYWAKNRENLREATMRQNIREAQKSGYKKIAVVCGAWHVPALKENVSAKADALMLKGLSKVKVEATWVPWSYPHMTRESGYGAGIHSPGWYEHLWNAGESDVPRPIGWLAKVATLLRSNDIDCSSAHLIEATRLSETLAGMRGYAFPGLQELEEATRTVICFGDEGPMRLIQKQLIAGDRIGSVPANVPTLPLQKDIEQTQIRLRMKPAAMDKFLELDLRTPSDLARSHFLHRLGLLNLNWGSLTKSGNSRGTFKEAWTLRWEPSFAVGVIEASRWGSTVSEAATNVVIERAQKTENLSNLAKLIDIVLLADLEKAVLPVTELLQIKATLTGDIGQMLDAIPPLANVFRYGSVRKTDTSLLSHVLDGLIIRTSINLSMACMSIDEESSAKFRKQILEVNQAISLRDSQNLTKEWQKAMKSVAHMSTAHSLLRGVTCRLMLDAGTLTSEEAATLMSLNLSTACEAIEASDWIDGFMNRNAMVLLHDNAAWSLIDAWLVSLSDDHFLSIVPLIRRTFSEFSSSERRDIATKVNQPTQGRAAVAQSLSLHAENAAFGIPILRTIFGLSI